VFAGKVVDAVRDYVGVRYEPTRIRRKALAEADAAIILANGDVRAQQVRAHALARLEFRETRRQDNIEGIVRGAIEAAPGPSTVADAAAIDPDWTAEFFDQCQDVSDAQMQTIWSKILAGEVVQPGRFSRRTLQAVRLLTKEEAENFSRLCGYLWLGDKEGIFFRSPSVFPYLATKQITYGTLLYFESIGLLSLNAARMIPHGSSLELDYHGQLFTLVPMTEPRTLPHPQFFVALLTVVGLQLALISGAEGDPHFPAIVRTSLLSDGIVLNTKESPGAQTPPPQPKP